MDETRSFLKSDRGVQCDMRFRLRYRLSLSPRHGEWVDSRSNATQRTYFAPSRIDVFYTFSPVISLAFQPSSLFHLVDSSCIYTPYSIAVLVVHWNKQGIGVRIFYHVQTRSLALSLTIQIMSARQPFRPTPRSDPQLSSSQPESSKVFHSQRIDADLGNPTNGTFNLSGLFNPKKRDQSLPTRKSKSHDDHQVPPQNISNNSWSVGPHTSKLDTSCPPSPVLSSTTSGLGTYQSGGIPSAQIEDIPSSPIVDNGSVTSAFFAQEANSQHLLPMINEVDEDVGLVNGPSASSAPLFFAGRYADDPGPRKRAQRMDDSVDNLENVNAKRFKSEQVGFQSFKLVRRLVTTAAQAGVRVHKQITPTLPRACCTPGTTQG